MMKLSTLNFLLVLLVLVSSGYSRSLKKQHNIRTNEEPSELCYGSILDAGSSSTKVSVYQWVCRDIVSLPKLNPVSKLYVKVSPGLSTFDKNIDGIANYLQPLISKIKATIPQELHASSPIMLGATAGMRLLSQEDQDAIINQANSILNQTGFLFAGQNWGRVITGSQEGVYLWISANFLMKSIVDHTQDTEDHVTTATTIDLGGASTQITFRVPREEAENEYVVLPQNNDYILYSTTYLGFGNDQARNAVIHMDQPETGDISSGCFNSGYSYTDPKTKQLVTGTSQPEECVQKIRKLFNKENCDRPDPQTCSINGSFQPIVPTDGPVVAVSGVNTAVNNFNLSSPFHPRDLLNASIEFCNLPYAEVQRREPGNSYASTKCFLGLYAASLLSDAFNLESYEINSPNKIQGAEPAWSMGYLFDNVAKLDCDKQTTVPSTFCPVYEFIQNHLSSAVGEQ